MGSFVAVLLALKRYLAPPGYDAAAAAAAGEALEVQPKLAALGLVNPPAAAITAAVRTGGGALLLYVVPTAVGSHSAVTATRGWTRDTF